MAEIHATVERLAINYPDDSAEPKGWNMILSALPQRDDAMQIDETWYVVRRVIHRYDTATQKHMVSISVRPFLRGD